MDCSCLLHPEEIIKDIELTYEEELVDPSFIEFDEINEQLAKSKKSVLADLRNDRNYRFIDNTIRELENWACFKQKGNKRKSVYSTSNENFNQLSLFNENME